VSWTALTTAESGYSSITAYTVQYKLASGSWISGGTSTGTSLTISGLTPLTTYFFQITSANVFGSGPTSTATVTSTTFGVPSAPSQPTVTQTSGSTQVIVTWSAPSNNGGTLISYSLQVLKLDGTTYQTIDSKCTEYDLGSTSILAASTTCTIEMTDLMTQGGFSVAGTYIKV